MAVPKTIKINNVEYVRAEDVQPKHIPGKRAVFVIDRGWMVAGDVTEVDGRIKLSRALHIFKFESVGFAGMVQNPKVKTDIRPLPNGFDVPAGSEIFRVWVDDNWGL
jgi:hypothetical protein